MDNSLLTWPEMETRPLSQDIKNLPTAEAELWHRVDPGTCDVVLEGPVFDRTGNFYFCENSDRGEGRNKVHKILPDGQASVIYSSNNTRITGLAVHKDGRIFCASMTGQIIILDPDGAVEKEIPCFTDKGEKMSPNDLTFDDEGNLYFTDLRGWINSPAGGVYRLNANDEYGSLTTTLNNLCGPNGISFSPDFSTLWIGESGRNAIMRIEISDDGKPMPGGSVQVVFRNTGIGIPDSNTTDSAGNTYHGIMNDGRFLILNKYGVPAANVLVPGRSEGRYLMSSNLTIKPDTSEAFCVAGGSCGAGIFKFPAIAPAQRQYSHY